MTPGDCTAPMSCLFSVDQAVLHSRQCSCLDHADAQSAFHESIISVFRIPNRSSPSLMSPDTRPCCDPAVPAAASLAIIIGFRLTETRVGDPPPQPCGEHLYVPAKSCVVARVSASLTSFPRGPGGCHGASFTQFRLLLPWYQWPLGKNLRHRFDRHSTQSRTHSIEPACRMPCMRAQGISNLPKPAHIDDVQHEPFWASFFPR